MQLKRTNGGAAEDRSVDFDNRNTIASAKGECKAFNAKDVAVEGYQKSNMKGDGRSRLLYGLLIKNIGPEFASVRVRVKGVDGSDSATAALSIPALANDATPVAGTVSFEALAFPPAGWSVRVQPGNVCQRSAEADLVGQFGLVCKDLAGSQPGLVRAGLQFALPIDRLPVPPMSWRLGAKIRTELFPTKPGTAVLPLAFLAGHELVAAAVMRRIHSGDIVAGLLIRAEDGMLRERIDVDDDVVAGTASSWELELLRVGTRETTAVLWLNRSRISQLDGHTTTLEPDHACAGVLHRHAPLPVTLHFDDLYLTEALR